MAVAYFAIKCLKLNRCIRRKQKADKPDLQKLVYFPPNENNICRICLSIGNIPIFGTHRSSAIVNNIQTFGDIKLDAADDFPKNLCEDCYNLLRGAIRFKTSAQESDQILRQKQSTVKSNESHITDADYDAINEDWRSNESEIPESYCCKLCKLSFKTNEEYETHQNSRQHKKVRIQCPICRGLITANLYKRHLVRHDSASHLICEVCGKLFRKDNLIRHLQLHTFELPYQCQICPYRGRYVDSLKMHMRTHTGEKPFSCGKCELRFITRSNLNRHLLTHNKQRPFRCVECARGFYTQRDMNAHFKSDHVGVKEFGCPMCGNKYGTRKALMRHELRVHKRDKMAKGRLPLYLQEEYKRDEES